MSTPTELRSKLFTPDEAAEALGVTAEFIRQQCAKGAIYARKIGSRWYIPVARLANQLGVEQKNTREDTPIE